MLRISLNKISRLPVRLQALSQLKMKQEFLRGGTFCPACGVAHSIPLHILSRLDQLAVKR